jgi:hypothetical protein
LRFEGDLKKHAQHPPVAADGRREKLLLAGMVGNPRVALAIPT